MLVEDTEIAAFHPSVVASFVAASSAFVAFAFVAEGVHQGMHQGTHCHHPLASAFEAAYLVEASLGGASCREVACLEVYLPSVVAAFAAAVAPSVVAVAVSFAMHFVAFVFVAGLSD